MFIYSTSIYTLLFTLLFSSLGRNQWKSPGCADNRPGTVSFSVADQCQALRPGVSQTLQRLKYFIQRWLCKHKKHLHEPLGN